MSYPGVESFRNVQHVIEKLQDELDKLHDDSPECIEIFDSLPSTTPEQKEAWCAAVREASALYGLVGNDLTHAIRNVAIRHKLCPPPRKRGGYIDRGVFMLLHATSHQLHSILMARIGGRIINLGGGRSRSAPHSYPK